jgi:predicted HTH transcriptional regulator
MEDHLLEYTETIDNHHLVNKTVGCLNTNGGRYIIGINKLTKQPSGIRFVQQAEERVVQILIDSIEPRPVIIVKLESHGQGDTITIDIAEGIDPPYYEKSKGPIEGVYVRVGSTTRLATKEDMARLYMKRQNLGYDAKVVTYFSNFAPSSIDIFNLSKVEGYVKAISKAKGVSLTEITPDHILSIKAASNVIDRICPTIAGILIFCDEPAKHMSELSYCYIKGARFKGEKVTDEIIDQKEIKCPLDEQIQKAFNFVKEHLNLGGIIKGVRREDVLEIPESVIRELIINAVAHRDYSIPSTINIAIFDDRIEFYSPGGLPSGVTPENIKDQSVIRNNIIADYLLNMKYIERFGMGWDKIILSMEEYGLSVPEIQDTGSSVKVIVRRRQIAKPASIPNKQEVLSRMEKIVLANLESDREYTFSEITQLLAKETSSRGIKIVLGRLKRKGYLEAIYEGRGSIKRIK